MKKKAIYNKILIQTEEIPKFFIGQEVQTSEGLGIIVEIKVPTTRNTLNVKMAYATIWFDKSDGYFLVPFKLTNIKHYDRY